MKTIKKIQILATGIMISSVFLLSCGGNENNNSDGASTEIKAENVVTADYSVDGMVCAVGCAATIQNEVSAMNGVALCEVDFDSHKAHIEFDKTQLSEEDIISKIETLADGQYKVNKWVQKNNNEATESNGEESDGSEEPITKISLPTFEIPNLFTLLMDQL